MYRKDIKTWPNIQTGKAIYFSQAFALPNSYYDDTTASIISMRLVSNWFLTYQDFKDLKDFISLKKKKSLIRESNILPDDENSF